MAEFVPENDLERALVAAASDPAKRPEFYRVLAASDLFIVQEGPPPPGPRKTRLEKGTQLTIAHVEIEGRPHVPVFSSLRRLQEFLTEPAGYLSANAREWFLIFRRAEIFLNPGAAYGKKFTHSEIEAIADGLTPGDFTHKVVQKATQVVVCQPKKRPTHLTSALAEHFKRDRQVEAAYLGMIINPEEQSGPHLIIAIKTSGDWDEMMKGVVAVLRRVAKEEDKPIDFFRAGEPGVAETLANQTEPFYRRTRFSETSGARLPQASSSAQRLVYFGTEDEVRLGDRVRVRALLVFKLEGVVCYVPGVSAKHKDMEYEGLRHVGIELRSGEVRQLHWVGGETSLGKGVTLLARDQPYKPLSPEVRLDPTNLDDSEEEPREKSR